MPVTTFPKTLKNMDQDRRRRYAAHLAFFQGDQWQTRPRTRADRQLTLNYAETILTAVAGLISDSLRTIITAPVERPETAARAANLAWHEIARNNALTTLDFETELDAAIMGDACYKVTWDPTTEQVKITSPDVQTLYAWWQPDDPNVLTQVAHQYRLSTAGFSTAGFSTAGFSTAGFSTAAKSSTAGSNSAAKSGAAGFSPAAKSSAAGFSPAKKTRTAGFSPAAKSSTGGFSPAGSPRIPLAGAAAPGIYPGGAAGSLPAGAAGGGAPREVLITERWTETEYDLWSDDTLTHSGPNPYGFIPYVIYPNVRNPKQFWGQSDIPRIQDVQRELNREISTLSLIMQLSGNPIAVLENVENAGDITVEPGAVWQVPEHARAYVLDLLERGGARLHVEYVQLLYRALHDLAQVPRSAFGDLGRSLSGVAMELDMAPLLRQVRRKRLSRQAAYQRRAELALRLLQDHNRLDRAPYTVQVTWGEVLPRDPDQEATRLINLTQSGLKSRTTAMAELGERDPSEEWSKARREHSQWRKEAEV